MRRGPIERAIHTGALSASGLAGLTRSKRLHSEWRIRSAFATASRTSSSAPRGTVIAVVRCAIALTRAAGRVLPSGVRLFPEDSGGMMMQTLTRNARHID